MIKGSEREGGGVVPEMVDDSEQRVERCPDAHCQDTFPSVVNVHRCRCASSGCVHMSHMEYSMKLSVSHLSLAESRDSADSTQLLD